MPLLVNGRNALADAWIGGTDFPRLNAANAHLAVGDGTTAFDASQTDLQGSSKARKAMDNGYPSRANNVDTFRATFGSSEANHGWKEWGVANAASGSSSLMTRKVEDLGTKVDGATWELTVTNTWT